eukprot:9380041-Lingulodinium_polyedra.AAC.1
MPQRPCTIDVHGDEGLEALDGPKSPEACAGSWTRPTPTIGVMRKRPCRDLDLDRAMLTAMHRGQAFNDNATGQHDSQASTIESRRP